MRLNRMLFVAVVAASPVISAQPSEPPVVPAPTGLDEAKIKEIVDREVARILTERAAREAGERAARETTEKETKTAEKSDNMSGSSGFMDTRLAFTLTNENILAKPGETIPSVPGWRFGTPNSLGVLFFDNYDTRFSGFETLSHGIMYRSYSSGHLQAEGAFVLRINELSESNISLADAGSYLVITNWKDPTHKDPTRISLTAFPVSSDRFRLGYSFRLSWGGSPEYKRARSSNPGFKLQYDTKNMYTFIGAKSAVVVDPGDGEQKSALAVLGGAGIDLISPSCTGTNCKPGTELGMRAEVNGGYFDRGKNELQDVQNQKVQLFGASGQFSIYKGYPLRSSVDYRLYRYNNEQISGLFAPEKYPGGLAWMVQAEATIMGQTLKDPENTGSTVNQLGHAGDVNVRVKYNRYRMRLDVSARDLAFILHSQPGLPPYSDFPADYKLKPNLFGAAGVDKNWGDWLTLGVIGGVEKPATLTTPKGIPGQAIGAGSGSSTAVVRNNNIDTLITILPPGEKALPQFALKGTAKVDFGRVYSALLEVYYSYDPNQTRYSRVCDDPQNCAFAYEPGQFNQLGVNVTLQARF
jgi:hypothetical protein